MGGKTKTTQSQDNTIDPYTRGRIDDSTNRIRGLLSGGFQPFEGQRVAGLSDRETNAFNQFEQNQGRGQGILGDALNTVKGGQSFADADLSGYQNPYTQNVIDTTNQEIRRQGDIAQAGVNADATAAGAFGGSRHGVQAAEQERGIQDTLARNTAQLNSQGFQFAADQFNRDQDRGLQRGGLLAGLASQYDEQNRNNALTSASFGAQERGIEQSRLDADYENYLREYQDLFNRVGVEQGLLSGTPVVVDSESSGTTQRGISPLQFGQTGLQFAGLLSDRRLKTAVKPHSVKDGRKWYTFRYLWDNPLTRRVGVMAQDLLESEPERILVNKLGYYAVNYDGMEAPA